METSGIEGRGEGREQVWDLEQRQTTGWGLGWTPAGLRAEGLVRGETCPNNFVLAMLLTYSKFEGS